MSKSMLLEWMKSAPGLHDDPRSGLDPDAVVVSEVIDIAAPASTVWAVLIDMPRYNEWNPFCVRAVSTLKIGDPVQMMLVNYSAPGTLVANCEYICAMERERVLSWELPWSAAWPYPARRDQLIEATGPSSCRYVSTDAFLGINGIHVFRFAGGWVKRAFDDSGFALKARAESVYQSER